jgi:tetratricopeptide (TPR) repeat protein
MANTRLELLKEMVQRNPADSFARYGLALEYRNAGDLASAIREFEELMAADPSYVPAYFHAGQALEAAGRTTEASAAYRRGIEVSVAKGDHHARTELEAALDFLQ